MYYLNSRYYDPELCRFISADSLAVPTISPGSANWDKNLYAYCDNDPVKREDDEGDSWEVVLAATVVGGLIGGVSSVINDYIMGRDVTFGSVLSDIAVGAVNGFTGAVLWKYKIAAAGISFVTAGINTKWSGGSWGEALFSGLTAASTSFVSGCALGMTSTDPPDITPPTPQPTAGPVVKNPFIPSGHDVFVVMGGGGKNTNKLAFR